MAWHDQNRVYPTKEAAFETAATLQYMDAGAHYVRRTVGGWELVEGERTGPEDHRGFPAGEVRPSQAYRDITPHDVDGCKDEPCDACVQDRVAAAEFAADSREDR